MTRSLERVLGAALLLSAIPPVAWSAPANSGEAAIAAGSMIPIEAHVPSTGIHGRYVLIDAASAQLFMMEDGHVVDSMRVIVGRPSAATPPFEGTIRRVTLNPYWNVPSDLARTIIAPRVLQQGLTYLRKRGYQVLSEVVAADARVLPPESVDWSAVAAGDEKVHVRQLPGPDNSMGQIKFDIASADGIFLHDTPNKKLFAGARRNRSNGCVRLEDAARFARWLLGREPELISDAPEQDVLLPRPVPIVITYLDPPALDGSMVSRQSDRALIKVVGSPPAEPSPSATAVTEMDALIESVVSENPWLR